MSNDTNQSDKTEGEKLTLEDAASLVTGYANLTAIWVQEARRHERGISDFCEQDHSVIYLEKLGEIVADLWDIWNRTTRQYPILRPVIRRMGATMLCFLQDVVVEDETLDDDTQWGVQVLIAHTSCKMEERMNLPPWRECLYGKKGERCRHSNDYEDDVAKWKCYHCHDRHADEATEAAPAEVPSEPQTLAEAINMCVDDFQAETEAKRRKENEES